MHDVIAMWRHTKMIVLVALSAAAYVAVLLPFKGLVIFPGFAEVRPGVVIPVLCGMLFGPAAAWGSAFGNLIADVFGMLGPGSLFGMVGNFLLAYVPYRMWRVLRGHRPDDGSAGTVPWFVLCTAVGSMCCAVTIGFGLEALSLFAMALFTPVVALMNTVFAGLLGALLMPLLYPRAKQWGLIYSDIMDPADYRAGFVGWPGLAVTAFSSLSGVLLAINYIPVGMKESGMPYFSVLPSGVSLAYAAGISSVLILVGTVLISPLGRSFGLLEERQTGEAQPDEQSEGAQEGEE